MRTTQMQTPDRYMTAREVAKLLAISPRTLYWWAERGRGPRGSRIGHEMRYDPADVQAWIDGLVHG